MTIKHLFLDLDGTLIDSSEGIYRSFSRACHSLDLEPPEIDQFKPLIGPPVDSIFSKIFTSEHTQQVYNFLKNFREFYNSEDYKLSSLYNSVFSTLSFIKETTDVRVSVITNKPTYPSERIISHLCLDSLIDSVIGIDYLKHHFKGKSFQSKYHAIEYAINCYSADRSTVLYVGDTTGDLTASSRARVSFVAATYGFYKWNQSELLSLKYINSFPEIMSIILL